MAIKLKRQALGSVAVPPASHIAFFIDENGNPALMDGNGDVRPAVSVDGSPLSLEEQGSAPASGANTVKLFAQEVDGATEFFALDDQGNSVQITSGGHLAGAPRIDWKDGTPGSPYVADDTVTAAFGTIVMVQVEAPDIVTIQLPPISAASAAQRIAFRNLIDKKTLTPGLVVLAPDAADQVDRFATGQAITPDSSLVNFEIESDGVGRWNFSGIGGGYSILLAYPPVPV